MPRDVTLARARAELASGSVPMATQRLRGLAGTFPLDLEIRAQLAEAYRAQGNLVQAGRWAYLSDHRDATETAAFERATPDPRERMRVLGWPADEEAASTPTAVQRLTALRAAAEERHGAPVRYSDLCWSGNGAEGEDSGGWLEALGCAAVAGLLVIVVGLFLLGTLHGAWIVARWLF
ncbi:DUF6584 family protein [Cryptosporangium minutisporangium]|uniref:DUF6584 family protein n=1 Tax=Cryptosporangium minutisporangium TaxID=113569 RepID=UPI0031E82C29